MAGARSVVDLEQRDRRAGLGRRRAGATFAPHWICEMWAKDREAVQRMAHAQWHH